MRRISKRPVNKVVRGLSFNLLRKLTLCSTVMAILFSILTSTVAWSATEVPAPSGDIYVQDFENLLSQEQENELRRLGRALEDRTKAQIAVLTIPTLGDLTIEEYANKAFRQYKLGDQKLNNGVLLLLSLEQREVRIEVGYGLEGALPDGKVGRFIDSITIPYIQENKPDQAIVETYKSLYNEVSIEYNVQDSLSPQSIQLPEVQEASNDKGSFIWIIIIVIFLVLDFTLFKGAISMTLLSMIGNGRGRGGGGGGGYGGGSGGGFRGGGGGSSGGGGASRKF
ncbi:TPM domain-containing protein [Paenibacillus sp. IHBB 10380]|uniref:TPM domain-containing protein n=1 Tax=Paenibacillus sp. IHBB 10380 TaxID=1566358 RepID=UPI0009E1CA6D|nr:TPM domain-containing protein [Paenibacillus sp. IHBB 10380]